jgi:F-type H+-transporting ATPase subunit epsilon
MTLEILTPQAQVFSGEATSLQVPGSKEKGSLQILDNHAPLISALQPGKVTVRTAHEEKVFFIKEGFIEVLNNHVAVLVEEAEMATE